MFFESCLVGLILSSRAIRAKEHQKLTRWYQRSFEAEPPLALCIAQSKPNFLSFNSSLETAGSFSHRRTPQGMCEIMAADLGEICRTLLRVRKDVSTHSAQRSRVFQIPSLSPCVTMLKLRPKLLRNVRIQSSRIDCSELGLRHASHNIEPKRSLAVVCEQKNKFTDVK